MKLFRKIRQNMITENKFSKYLIYAIGEVILVVIGILIAININERISNNKDKSLRCQYLNELKFVFDYDIKDVEENLQGFAIYNPKLEKLFQALQENNLMNLDSISDKLNAASQYVFFGQRSVSKIEELKYSSVNLIIDRSLKNRILLYQVSHPPFF